MTQTHLIERNRVLKGRITLIRFDADTKLRTMTHSNLTMPRLLEEIISSTRYSSLIIKCFVDLPFELDGISSITPEWLEAVETYEMNLYI